jgi:hypothetical protein
MRIGTTRWRLGSGLGNRSRQADVARASLPVAGVSAFEEVSAEVLSEPVDATLAARRRRRR